MCRQQQLLKRALIALFALTIPLLGVFRLRDRPHSFIGFGPPQNVTEVVLRGWSVSKNQETNAEINGLVDDVGGTETENDDLAIIEFAETEEETETENDDLVIIEAAETQEETETENDDLAIIEAAETQEETETENDDLAIMEAAETKADKGIIYGHVHIAKTAGSSLLDVLAGKYDRVCSNKSSSREFNATFKHKRCKDGHEWHQYQPKKFLDYLDQCDYVSAEFKSPFWYETEWNRTMELHIPCKDPLNMLMSNCFWPRGVDRAKNKVRGFDCSPEKTTDKNLETQIRRCLGGQNGLLEQRFSETFVKKARQNGITMKCFDNDDTFDAYQDYMDPRLKHRDNPIEINMCWPRLRNRDTECIWKDEELQARVIRILLHNYYYFRYCKDCLFSPDNLIHQE